MKKRLISFLLTAAMILTLVPIFTVSVSAATQITTGWENNSKGVSGATEIAELCTDPANVLSGNNSLHIKYVPAVEGSTSDSVAGQAQARCGQWSNTGVNWTLTFWAKFVTGDITGLKLGFFEYVTAITEDNAVDGAVVDGWQKYSITATDKANNNERFYIISNFKDVEVYLDNFTLTCAEGCAGGHDNHGLDILNDTTGATTKKINSGGIGETAEDPLDSGEEEPEEPYVPSVTPDTTGIAMDGAAWIENTSDAGFSQTGTVKDLRYSAQDYYAGNRSFHIQYDEPKDESGALGLQLRNKTQLPTTQNATYTVSFYAKGTGLENVQTAYPRYDKISLTDTSWYKTTATDKEGWVKYTYTRNIPGSSCDTFRIYINGKADFYIDELVITDQAGTTEYLNLDFDFVPPTVAEDLTMVPSAGLDGATGQDYRFLCPSNGISATTQAKIDAGEFVYDFGLSYLDSYGEGNRSLRLQSGSTTKSDSVNVSIRTQKVDFNTGKGNADKYFKLTFYAKGKTDNVIVVFFNYSAMPLKTWETTSISKVTFSAVADAGDGWKKYEAYGYKTAGQTDWPTFRFYGTTDAFIDNITIAECDENGTVTGTDMYNGLYTFDTAETVIASKPVLYNGTETVEEFTTDLSDKTIKAKAWVKNINDNDMTSARVFIALYKDDMLVDVTDSIPVSPVKGGDIVWAEAELTLPTITDVTGYELKAFIWDSWGGMRYLAETTEI